MKRFLFPALLVLPSLLLLAEVRKEAAAPAPAPAAEVVAVGDVHGDFPTFRKLLRRVGLTDEQDRWQGGARHLVQTGDLLDRGSDSRAALDFLMRLEKEAEAAGGRVVAVLGNHEVMNVIGDLRYVSSGEFAAFEKDEDPRERARRTARILDLVQTGSPLLRSRYYRTLGRFITPRTFDRYFPPGFFAHREAFAPTGRYGSWLLQKKAIHLEGKTLFVHGGLSLRHGTQPLEEIDRRVKAMVAEYLRLVGELETLGVYHRDLGVSELHYLIQDERRAGGPLPEVKGLFRRVDGFLEKELFDEEGPLWYRGLALGEEKRLSRAVDAVLRAHGAERIVMGHTVTRSGAIEERFNGRVVLIDTGMNQAVYGGKPSALLLLPDGKTRVLDSGR